MRHFGVMVLTPEQHSSIAMAYEKAAADEMVPPPQRAAFARKADWFRMLARIGAKQKLLATTPKNLRHGVGEDAPDTSPLTNGFSGTAFICVAETSVASHRRGVRDRRDARSFYAASLTLVTSAYGTKRTNSMMQCEVSY